MHEAEHSGQKSQTLPPPLLSTLELPGFSIPVLGTSQGISISPVSQLPLKSLRILFPLLWLVLGVNWALMGCKNLATTAECVFESPNYN